MQYASVVYFVVTMFVVVYSLPEQCVVRDYFRGIRAYCGRKNVEYTFDFIPPVSANISYIDFHRQPLQQLPYDAFRNLSSQNTVSTIILSSCHIRNVDAGALLNLHSLAVIDLSHNEMNQIDSQLFSHTKQISLIFLNYNNIEVLPCGLFQNLPLLHVVFLQNNRIRQVERFSFKHTPSLRLISLYNNDIEFMNMSFKDQFDNLTTLSLYGNPWKCNCELRPLYEFYIKLKKPMYGNGPVCENPPTLHGREWSDISRDEFVCPSEDATSTQDSVMTSTEPTTTKEADDTIPVTVYDGTRHQPVDTGMPQSPSNQNWIPHTILVLVLVCIVPVITGVVFVVRRTPTIVKRRSDRRTNSGNLDSGLPMLVVQSSAVSEDGGSTSNMADVDEESTSIHHNGLREATIN